jgi:hypothetical protein
MARTSVAVLERELEYARKREAWLKRSDRPVKQTVDRRPKVLVGYKSSLITIGAASITYKVQVVQTSLTFIAGSATGFAALGLIGPSDTDFALAQPKPKALKPAMVRVSVGDATPSVRTAAGSGRRYINYAANAAGDAQAHYSAPVSNTGALVTPAEQKTAATTRINAIRNNLGGSYGRATFIPETYPQSLV